MVRRAWRALLLGLCILVGTAPPVGAASPIASPIRLCFDDVDVHPWHSRTGTGLSFAMLDEVARRTGVTFTYTPLPWRRCLALVGTGEQDGAVGASFSPERQKLGVYPARAGTAPDPARRMAAEGYSLYTRPDTPLAWDGTSFSALKGRIAVQAGYSIRDVLVAQGVDVDDSDKDPAMLFRKLLLGAATGAVLVSGEGERLLSDPRYTGKVVRVGPPLQRKEYYLLLSRPLVAADPSRAERLWDEVAAVRASESYREKARQMGVFDP